MGQEYILQPQLFESHVSFLSSNSMTAKNINTTTVLASALSAEYVLGSNFSSGTPSISATFTGVYYGWGWELEGVDKGQPGVNSWVRSNSTDAVGFNTLSAKNVYGDFLGSTRFRAQSANVITTNTAAGSSTFHGVYYGDGWNLQGIDRSQPGINAWVRSNSSIATGFDTLSAKNIYGNFIGSQAFKNANPVIIATNTAAGNSTFHGVFYGDGRNLLGVSFDQPEINAWVRSNSAVETLGSFWIEATAGNVTPAPIWSKTVYGNGRFVSISYNTDVSNIATSMDGINWSTTTSPVTALIDVTYGNGLFVAISDLNAPDISKQIATSIDGTNWLSNTSVTANWQGIAYGNGCFIAVSVDGYGYWSKDCKAWQNLNLPLLSWKGICYANNEFKIVGSDLVGSDVETYIGTITPPFDISSIPSYTGTTVVITPWYNNKITYGNGVYILTTDEATNQYYTSTDSVDWVQRTLLATGTKKRCVYGDGLFTLTSNKTTTGTVVYLSKDGILWNERYQTNTLNTTIHSIGYGNGMFIAGSTSKMYVTGRLRTPNEPLINVRHGDSIQYGNKNITGKLTVANLSANSNSVSFVVENGGELQKRFLNFSIIPQYTFTKDLSVSLGSGKTFGRYVNGNVIASTGKTVPEVLEMSLIEPITPDATLTSSSTVAFNTTTSITNALTFTYKLCSLGATVDTSGLTRLEYSRNNSAWSTINTYNTVPTSPTTYNHVFTDPLTFNGATTIAGTTTPFYYRFTLTDSAGAARTVTFNITPASYSAPTLTGLGAIVTTRYKGDISTTYSGTLNRINTSTVPLSSWQLQRSINNNTSWTNRNTISYITTNPASTAISFTDNETSNSSMLNATSVYYRVQHTDSFTTAIAAGPQTTSGSTTAAINFVHRNVLFYSTKDNVSSLITIADIDAAATGGSTVPGAILSTSRARGPITGVTPPANMYTYYAYEASLGNLTSVVLDGATGILNTFLASVSPSNPGPTDVTGTNTHGATVTYKVYRSTSQGAFSNQTLQFT